ncbi:hypothetical protein CL615_03980 [archaeon]|jgi:Zn ribbon nucleic-acid-binding protein|nr:hypothetical protein [archaeon]MDP6547976.1 hypothetical protein [Candidatus Woesearchaeota archaeon]|tara:strand:- start:67038 stop:67241 length:204 start_codon:yes stop_codon:yes gene_type:complete
MSSTKCPKCSSGNIKTISYLGIECIICNDCGYDETKQYEVYPEKNKSQKQKGKYTPYKTGGFKRSRK